MISISLSTQNKSWNPTHYSTANLGFILFYFFISSHFLPTTTLISSNYCSRNPQGSPQNHLLSPLWWWDSSSFSLISFHRSETPPMWNIYPQTSFYAKLLWSDIWLSNGMGRPIHSKNLQHVQWRAHSSFLLIDAKSYSVPKDFLTVELRHENLIFSANLKNKSYSACT